MERGFVQGFLASRERIISRSQNPNVSRETVLLEVE
jgi:hypothetical protein